MVRVKDFFRTGTSSEIHCCLALEALSFRISIWHSICIHYAVRVLIWVGGPISPASENVSEIRL